METKENLRLISNVEHQVEFIANSSFNLIIDGVISNLSSLESPCLLCEKLKVRRSLKDTYEMYQRIRRCFWYQKDAISEEEVIANLRLVHNQFTQLRAEIRELRKQGHHGSCGKG